MLTYVLFDLDGTLLPMDQEVFVKAYFTELSRRICPLGYTPEALTKAVWHGTKRMMQNDGSRTNETVFWNSFAQDLGEDILRYKSEFDDFYRTDFNRVQNVCGMNPKVPETVRFIQEHGIKTAVATLPVFPAEGILARLRWAGIDPAQMAYITSYENCRYSKPNPAFFTEITEKLGVAPENCLMVGNNVDEDMIAQTLGMSVFLLTDCLINEHAADINAYPHGSFDDLQAFLQTVF